MEILEKAALILDKYPLCSTCLGRQFSLLGHGFSNEERGDAIRVLITLEASRILYSDEARGRELLDLVTRNDFSRRSLKTFMKVTGSETDPIKGDCYLCTNIFPSLDTLVNTIVTQISQYEFAHFLVGIKLEASVIEREDEMRAELQIHWGESIRNDLSREIGKRIAQITEKEASFSRPDILITVNPFTNEFWITAHSLLIAGRYRKFHRGIPQAKWVCSNCQGAGCETCQGLGKFYPDSIEELIARPLLQATDGTDVKIHAAGREDIDVRVLGPGRPFIIEVLHPIKRNIDLSNIQQEINIQAKGKIEVETLQFTSKKAVKRLKSRSGNAKVYRSIVELASPISDDAMVRLTAMRNLEIQQFTPTRVQHRRAFRLRRKKVYQMSFKRLNTTMIEFTIHCQGGLYIKEFISGDEGRTTPSVAEILSVPARSIELDVLDIDREGVDIA
jgi:tRNA pseudouridine synthase 10